MSNEQIEELRIEALPKNSQEYEIYEMTTVGIGSTTNSSINLGFMKIKDEIIPIVIKTSVIKEWIGIDEKVKKLKEIKNDSIIKYYGSKQDNNKLILFLKYFNRGDLENYKNLGQNKSSDLSERQIIDIFLRICKAIKFLHSEKNISHRDIKPLNVLMDFKNIVLIDFETCKITIPDNETTRTRYGTKHYMAPEIVEGRKEYLPKLADIFSLGVTLFYMFFPGLFPYEKLINPKKNEKIKDFFPPKHIRNLSPEIMELIMNMIKIEPKERPTLNEIITTCKNFLEKHKTIISMVYPIQTDPKIILHKDFKLKGNFKDINIINELLLKEKNTYYESLIYQRFLYEISFARFIIHQVKNLMILKDIFYNDNNKKLWKKGVFYLLCRGYIHLFYFFQIFSKKAKNSNNFFNENKKVLENLSENNEEYEFIMNIFKNDLKIIKKKITKFEKKIKCLNLVDIKNPKFLREFQNNMIIIINCLLRINKEEKQNNIRNFIKFISDILFFTIDFSKRNYICNIEKYVEDVEKCEEDFDFLNILKILK